MKMGIPEDQLVELKAKMQQEVMEDVRASVSEDITEKVKKELEESMKVEIDAISAERDKTEEEKAILAQEVRKKHAQLKKHYNLLKQVRRGR